MTPTNDIQTAYAIRRELEDACSQMPASVLDRLAAARRQALARVPEATTIRPLMRQIHHPPARRHRSSALHDTPTFWTRLTVMAVPALTVVLGLFLIGNWSEARRIQELADIDAGVLVDDLPIAAYADRGFGVYLKNTRGWVAVAADQDSSGSGQ